MARSSSIRSTGPVCSGGITGASSTGPCLVRRFLGAGRRDRWCPWCLPLRPVHRARVLLGLDLRLRCTGLGLNIPNDGRFPDRCLITRCLINRCLIARCLIDRCPIDRCLVTALLRLRPHRNGGGGAGTPPVRLPPKALKGSVGTVRLRIHMCMAGVRAHRTSGHRMGEGGLAQLCGAKCQDLCLPGT